MDATEFFCPLGAFLYGPYCVVVTPLLDGSGCISVAYWRDGVDELHQLHLHDPGWRTYGEGLWAGMLAITREIDAIGR